MPKRFAMFALLVAVGLLAACSGGSSDESGVLRVNLTDAQAQDLAAVNVTITSVRVHQSSGAGEMDAGWIDLPVTATMPVDLMTLRNGVLYQLCQAQLPPGDYQQVRLELAPNTGMGMMNQSVMTTDGVVHAMDMPSGSVKILHAMSVTASQTTELTLDFDAAASVNQQGNGTWMMQPVITASSK